MSARHAALAQRWHEAWSGRDARAFVAICAPDLHYEDPLTAEPLYGAQALGVHAERLWRAFPDALMEPTGEPLGDGRWLALPLRLRGRNSGPLGSLPASHRDVVLHAVCWCELALDGERLWRVRAYYDAHAAAVELGLLPRPGSWRRRAVLALQGYGILGSSQ
ncbi:MAG TPA: ester cyclase [Solirubrobacteraceae bacterium]|nr:ester cyclase [Solirubrobacteraceae bacterium]